MTAPDFQTPMEASWPSSSTASRTGRAASPSGCPKRFKPSDAERARMLPKGWSARSLDRVEWAVTHLALLGIAQRPQRGSPRAAVHARSLSG